MLSKHKLVLLALCSQHMSICYPLCISHWVWSCATSLPWYIRKLSYPIGTNSNNLSFLALLFLLRLFPTKFNFWSLQDEELHTLIWNRCFLPIPNILQNLTHLSTTTKSKISVSSKAGVSTPGVAIHLPGKPLQLRASEGRPQSLHSGSVKKAYLKMFCRSSTQREDLHSNLQVTF